MNSNRMADAFLGTIAIAALAAGFIILVLTVWGSMGTPDCERLYNEYTNTTSMTERGVLFERGMDNGCFHND